MCPGVGLAQKQIGQDHGTERHQPGENSGHASGHAHDAPKPEQIGDDGEAYAGISHGKPAAPTHRGKIECLGLQRCRNQKEQDPVDVHDRTEGHGTDGFAHGLAHEQEYCFPGHGTEHQQIARKGAAAAFGQGVAQSQGHDPGNGQKHAHNGPFSDTVTEEQPRSHGHGGGSDACENPGMRCAGQLEPMEQAGVEHNYSAQGLDSGYKPGPAREPGKHTLAATLQNEDQRQRQEKPQLLGKSHGHLRHQDLARHGGAANDDHGPGQAQIRAKITRILLSHISSFRTRPDSGGICGKAVQRS